MALKKFCSVSGCRNLCDIGNKYCDDHAHLLDEQNAERYKRYDKQVRHGRDQLYTEFYHSNEWDKARIAVLNMYNGMDPYAYYVEHKIEPATMVHHIMELKEFWSLRLDLRNLIPLSDSSHKKIGLLYKSGNDVKEETQDKLMGLIERWRKEMVVGVVGKV